MIRPTRILALLLALGLVGPMPHAGAQSKPGAPAATPAATPAPAADRPIEPPASPESGIPDFPGAAPGQVTRPPETVPPPSGPPPVPGGPVRSSPPSVGAAPGTPPGLIEGFGTSAAPAVEDDSPIEGRPVKEVRIQGNLKIERDAILAAIQIKAMTAFSATQIRRDVKALYALGFFRDVQVDVARATDGVVVTYIVVEKPSIRTVRVEGNDKLDKDDIQEVITLKLFSILNSATVQENAVKIKDLYAEKGYYLAEVTPEVRPLNENEVEVIFRIRENAKVLVQKIYFVGAEKVDPADFKNFLQTKEGGFLSFLTSSGAFNQEQLENDALIIQAYYNEKGYVQARAEKPLAFMGPDKKEIYVTFKIHEGERYRMGSLSVTGDLLKPAAELEALLKTRPGDWFSRSALNEDIQALTDSYADAGYAFANVVPIPEIHEDTRTVDIRFEIDKGRRIYLDNIKISGNTVTWDKAIRREILINEGEMYRGSVLKDAKRRLERLGYFEEVKISTPKAGSEDTLNMEVDVTEKPTGTFNIGAGFSSIENFIFNANISKQNFLGLGYVMSAAASISQKRQQYNLSFFDPYFLDTRWTLRVDGYNIDTNYLFSEFRRGGDLSLGHYIGRGDDARFALKYTFENVGMRQLTPMQLQMFGGELFRGGDVSSLEASFTWDKRNNRITATSGYLMSASSELAGGIRLNDSQILSFFGGDFNFWRNQFNFRVYVPLYKKIEDLAVLRVNTTLGAIWSTDGRMMPVLQRYRAGGINSVRGYQVLSLGPTLRVVDRHEPSKYDTPMVIGGYQILTTNLEIEFAMLRAAGIRGVVFVDMGDAFDLFGFDGTGGDETNGIQSDTIPRFSTGFGVRWFSPMGPLRFEWGFPINRRESDRKQVFEFTIGSFF